MGYYAEDSRAVAFTAGVLLGATLGASLALLLAPQSGRRTRRRLLGAVDDARFAAGDRLNELGDEVRDAVRQGRRKLKR